MHVKLLKSKIHRATVTETDLDYTGSISIDKELMDAAGILDYEKVLVANVTNGTRHETYAVPAPAASGSICVMGAAAHLVSTGDKVIIMAFAAIEADEVPSHKPKIIVVNDQNQPINKK